MRCIIKSTLLLTALTLLGCQARAVEEAKPLVDDETKPAAAEPRAQGKPLDKAQSGTNLPTYWIVGDSTVRNGTPPRAGWGEVIAPLFDQTRINVVNKAIGGRSTRNYIAQGRWKEVLDKAKPGDYVTVQFGHNDRGSFRGPKGDRGVIPGVGDETQEVTPDPNKPDEKVVVHTYGWYLRQFISDARARKLNIILVTPVARNNWTKDGKLNNDIRPWAEYMIEVARAEKVPLLDLNAIVAGHYSEMGKDKVDGILFEGRDQTHTTKAGAEFNARCVAEGLRKLDGCNLKDYLVSR
jgi:rhamnogalacturonan acetylesterase